MLSMLRQFLVPRRWCAVITFTLFLVAFVLIFQGIVFMTVYAGVRHLKTQQELEAMIPDDTQGKLSLVGTSQKIHKATSSKSEVAKSVSDYGLSLYEDNFNHGLQTGDYCQTFSPKVLFFVRIPKCASTSFVELLQALSRSYKFELYFHPSGAFNWDREKMKQTALLAQSRANDKKGFVYARHFYYIDFHEFGLSDYSYVTIIRDPVSRYISSYLYYHFSSKPHIQGILNPEHKEETIETCLKHQHEGCTYNLITKYFCGHEQLCKLGNYEALQKAKSNLEKEFVVVGIMEEMSLSMEVMKRLLPKYFGELLREDFPAINKNEHSLDVSPQVHEAIMKANAADVMLYNFAQDRLHQKAKDCGLLA